MLKKSALALVLVTSAFVVSMACGKKSSSTTNDSTTDTGGGSGGSGVVTTAQLAGTSALISWYAPCHTVTGMGSALNGWSYLTTITFHTNGQYNYSVQFFNDTNCQYGSGTDVFAYNLFGSYTIVGAASSPSGASQISFSRSSELVTMYGQSAGATGSTWAGYFNAYCTGGQAPNFSTSANSSQDPFGFICTSSSSPQFTLPNFPNSNATMYNVLTYSTSGPTISISAPSNLWTPGNGSYPGSESVTFAKGSVL